MKALDLYKFIQNNNIEYRWYDKDVIMFVNCSAIEEFNKLLGPHILDDNGIECRMKDGYFCFMMANICEYSDIELIDIFPNKT
jgi:hypothetical protein